MKRSFFIAGMYVLLTGSAFASFSEWVLMTPDVHERHHEYQLEILSISDDADEVMIRFPYRGGSQKYWLVTAKRALEEHELRFRDFLWVGQKPEYIEAVVPLTDLLTQDALTEAKETGYVSLSLSREVLSRSYLYHDYASMVFDGGYYYTYALLAYDRIGGVDAGGDLTGELGTP